MMGNELLAKISELGGQVTNISVTGGLKTQANPSGKLFVKFTYLPAHTIKEESFKDSIKKYCGVDDE